MLPIIEPAAPSSQILGNHGAGGRIRTYEAVWHQIYSLAVLTTHPPLRAIRPKGRDFQYIHRPSVRKETTGPAPANRDQKWRSNERLPGGRERPCRAPVRTRRRAPPIIRSASRLVKRYVACVVADEPPGTVCGRPGAPPPLRAPYPLPLEGEGWGGGDQHLRANQRKPMLILTRRTPTPPDCRARRLARNDGRGGAVPFPVPRSLFPDGEGPGRGQWSRAHSSPARVVRACSACGTPK